MQTLAENPFVEKELVELASRYLPDSISREESISSELLSGDAGFRNYFRLSTQPSVLGVYSNPEQEDWVAFMRVSHLLDSLKVRVPQIYAANLQAGMLIIEDLGDQVLQPALMQQDHTERLYKKALESLTTLLSCQDRPSWLPRYSDALLRQEMELFPTWFVQKMLGHKIDEAESKLFTDTFSYLVSQALDQPQVLVHRDYHCRNLIEIDAGSDKENKGIGVIDFQDAVWGPVTYDLVSLSRDCYVRWNRSRVTQIREDFAQNLLDASLIDEEQIAHFPQWFECMSAQRHLKVLGIFARLALRDGKNEYLSDLPLALRYLIETCEQEVYLQNFADWLKNTIVPLAENQPWYVDWRTAGNDKTVW